MDGKIYKLGGRGPIIWEAHGMAEVEHLWSLNNTRVWRKDAQGGQEGIKNWIFPLPFFQLLFNIKMVIVDQKKKIHTSSNSTIWLHNHVVWKSQKKSHSTLRAKQATFTYWVEYSLF